MSSFRYVDSVSSGQSGYAYGATSVSNPPQFALSAASSTLEPTASSSSSLSGASVGSSNVDSYVSSNVTSNDVDKAHDAMYCAGTDDPVLEGVLNRINKDNVMNFMLRWNDDYSAEKGESFMKAFMWDADSDQKVKYGRQIARALKAKAKEVGVYDELADKFAKIDAEMNSSIYINNGICDTYDEIIAKIAEAEGKENGTPRECYDGFAGAMETCKEYGYWGCLVAYTVGTVYNIGKGIVDFFI